MADAQKTEQPTKRRLEKARREGQFPVSREMVAAVHYLAFVWLLFASGDKFISAIYDVTRHWLKAAFEVRLDAAAVVRIYAGLLYTILVPILIFGGTLATVLLGAQLATTRLGISFKRLAPDLQKLNPAPKLRDMLTQNVASFFHALVVLPLIGGILFAIARLSLNQFIRLPLYGIAPAVQILASSLRDMLTRFAWIIFMLGCIDSVRQMRRHSTKLRMTRQEVKDEHKETEGDPQIKARVRRIQRDLARRNMMKEVPKATAVVVNPTHYSVAIRYDLDSMAAPLVVAKGKNYLALRIRQIALEHQVPIVENQPLAQALYKSADVGQEIPARLYRAVAEILVYIYKLMNGRRA